MIIKNVQFLDENESDVIKLKEIVYKPYDRKTLKEVLKFLKNEDKKTTFIKYKGWLVTFLKGDQIGILTGLQSLYILDNDIAQTQLSKKKIKDTTVAEILNGDERRELVKLIKKHYYDKTRSDQLNEDIINKLVINLNDDLITHFKIYKTYKR